MAKTLQQVFERWMDVCEGRAETNWSNQRMPINGRQIFTWNRWIPLATYLGNGVYLLNGDEQQGGAATSQQFLARRCMEMRERKHVVIPYAALDAAGVDHRSIKIIDSEPDTNIRISHRTTVRPAHARWVTTKVWATQQRTEDEIAVMLQHQYGNQIRIWERDQRAGRVREKPTYPTADDLSVYQKTKQVVVATRQDMYLHWMAVKVEPQEDGTTVYSWEENRHQLGGSLIEARVQWSAWTRCKACEGTGRSISFPNNWCGVCAGDGRISVQRGRTTRFLSAFDKNEVRPVYFFCEMPPKSQATTMAEAYEELKPDAVLLAEEQGRKVARQGDIFAIRLSPEVTRASLRKQGASFLRMGRLFDTNHVATEVARLPNGVLLARGMLHHRPVGRAPDHSRVRLDEGWSLIQKNTVPIARH